MARKPAAPLPSFRQVYRGTLTRPRRTFDALMSHPHRLRYGLFGLLIAVIIYNCVYIFLTIGGGAPSSFTPWLAIPKDVYYFYNQFMLAPSLFLAWILSAGTVQLLAKPFGGKGSFEDTLSVLGLAIGISVLPSALHDFTDSLLGAVGLLDLRAYEVLLNTPTIWRTILWTLYGLYFALFLVLFPKGVGASQRIGRWPSILLGVLAFILYQVFFLIFNR